MSTQHKTLFTPSKSIWRWSGRPKLQERVFRGRDISVMAGARAKHSTDCGECAGGTARTRLRGSGHAGHTRQRLEGAERFRPPLCCYPDVSAFCGEPQFLDGQLDTLLNPSLVVEVLSPSTEAYDRGRKFELYQAIESLREYLLLASDRMHADLYTRQADGSWLRFGRLERRRTRSRLRRLTAR